jgi:hypothetical protein
MQSGVPKQGSRFTGGISNEYQNILDDFARQHYMEFGRKEGRGIAGLPTIGRSEMEQSLQGFTPREFTMANYGYNPEGALTSQQFAEGGQVMGGMQPMTPASENSGIASGMMPESSQQKGMQMMQQMAGQMEQVYSGLDNAEDIEDVINAMRGNQEPLSERYSELADLVGPEDAKKTPESVLTVLQPTFQILQGVPDSGIAEAPMGGVEGSEGNFSQPSATEPSDQVEAVLAMSRGEMPVKAATGYYAGDMNFMGNPPAQYGKTFPSPTSMNNAQTTMGGNVPQTNNNAGLLPYMPSKLAPPGS